MGGVIFESGGEAPGASRSHGDEYGCIRLQPPLRPQFGIMDRGLFPDKHPRSHGAGMRKVILTWIARLTCFAFVFLYPLPSPSFAAPRLQGDPADCLACHTAVLGKTVQARHVHPPIFDRQVNRRCFQCHIDSNPSSSRPTSLVVRYEPQLTLDHRIQLTGLSPLTTYYFRVKSTDRFAVQAAMPREGRYHFTTRGRRGVQRGQERMKKVAATRDSFPPEITDVSVAEFNKGVLLSATIVWRTDEPSDSQVEYGTGSSRERMTLLDSAAVMEHRVTIHGLDPGRTYVFRVRSTDPSGNASVSGDHVFTTPSTRKSAKRQGHALGLLAALAAFIRPSWAFENAPLTIFNLEVSQLDHHSATIVWETDRPADSMIEYDSQNESLDSTRFTHLPLKDRRETTIAGCYECHPKLLTRASHPVGIYPRASMTISKDLPRIENGLITCVTCHYPHSSAERYLLRKNWRRELCVSCHDPKDLGRKGR